MRAITAAKDIRRSIHDRQPLPKAWFVPSNGYGWFISLRILLPFFGLLAVAPVVWASWSPWLVPLLLPALGVYGYKIGFIMHDCAHNSLFRSVRLNELMGQFCGLLVGSPFTTYKRLHMRHHRHNGREGDPQRSEAWGFQGASRGKLLWHLLGPLVGSRAIEYVLGAGVSPADKANPSLRPKPLVYVAILLAQLGIAALATGGGSVPYLIVLYPTAAATFALFFARLRTFAEHVEPPTGSYPDFTRSHRPGLVAATLLYDAHFAYHREHHLYPQMPSCSLARLQASYCDLIHPTEETLRPSMFDTIVRRVAQASK